MTTAAYGAWLITMGAGFPVAAGFIVAFAVAALFGWAIELIYRPFRRLAGGQLAVFIVSLAVFILGENIIHLIFKADPRTIKGFPVIPVEIGGVSFTSLDVLIVVLSGLVFWGLWMYLRRTASGKAIQAVASNQEMAETVGIDARRIFVLVFALGSGVAGLAAVLYILQGVLTPFIGMDLLLPAAVVTFVGGVGSLPGAMVAGLLLGISVSISSAFVLPEFQSAVPFIILLVVIILRPRGLLGVER